MEEIRGLAQDMLELDELQGSTLHVLARVVHLLQTVLVLGKTLLKIIQLLARAGTGQVVCRDRRADWDVCLLDLRGEEAYGRKGVGW